MDGMSSQGRLPNTGPPCQSDESLVCVAAKEVVDQLLAYLFVADEFADGRGQVPQHGFLLFE
jgi:hypothetical protein